MAVHKFDELAAKKLPKKKTTSLSKRPTSAAKSKKAPTAMRHSSIQHDHHELGAQQHSSSTLSSLALLVGRWGTWPGWTPLLLHTFAANPTIAFFLLSDVSPARSLPRNVRHVPLTLPQLLARLRGTVGVRLTSLTASGTYGSGVSSAKTNDFKPMFGAAFSEMLQGFAWWGYLQEDLLVGDLRSFATEALLARSDVICPYLHPLNASGVLMLYRNLPRINWLWNTSKDVRRVLSSKSYQVFDEWWGPLEGRDNLARLLGRAADRGDIRLSLSPIRRKWMADDKRYGPRSAVTTNEDFVACWSRGVLWGNAQGAPHPCKAAPMESGRSRRRNSSAIAAANDVAVVHISRLKRSTYLAHLDLHAVRHAIAVAHTFALTANGVWIPAALCEDDPTFRNRYGLDCGGYEAEGHCANGAFAAGHEWAGGAAFQWPERHCCVCGRQAVEGAKSATRDAQHVWASGLLPAGDVVHVSSARVVSHLAMLEARDAAARCTISSKRAARSGGTGCAKLVAAAEGFTGELPCVINEHQGVESQTQSLGARLCLTGT